MIQAGGEAILFALNKLINVNWNKEGLPHQEYIPLPIYKTGDEFVFSTTLFCFQTHVHRERKSKFVITVGFHYKISYKSNFITFFRYWRKMGET
jgi:hypothetical protein